MRQFLKKCIVYFEFSKYGLKIIDSCPFYCLYLKKKKLLWDYLDLDRC